MELGLIARHGESGYNVAGRVNGDHSIPVSLTPRGREQARELARELAGLHVEACVHTRFSRTLETGRLALRDVMPQPRFVCEPLLDDIGCGTMEGWQVRRDHAWRGARGRDRRPPGGESVRDAALRIARGLRAVADRPEAVLVVVTHELAVRYALNGSCAGDDVIDLAGPWREIPHAVPFRIERDALLRAADRTEALASGAWGRAIPGIEANGG